MSTTPPGAWARGHKGTNHRPPADSCFHSVGRGGARWPLRAIDGCTAALVCPTGLFQVISPYPVLLQCHHCEYGHPSVGELCSHLQSEPTLPALAFLFCWMYKCQRHKWQPPISLRSLPANAPALSTLLPSSLTFALPAASGQSPARSHSLIMVPQASGLLLLCFLLQLQGPLGTAGKYICPSREGFSVY